MLREKNKGITLVALVITIIILLILAGISISALTNTGIFGKAKEAKSASENAEEKQNDVLEEYQVQLNKYISNLPSTNDTEPYLPDNTFSKFDGTIDTGLVIQDNLGNQYVWVVVPKSLYNDVKYNLNGTKKPTSNKDYDNIEYCLHQYTMTYRKGKSEIETNYTDTWADDTSNESWFSKDEYISTKQKMLQSIYENGGFYVGRYEAGITINRKTNNDKNSEGKYIIPDSLPVSREGVYPYTFVTRTQAQKLAEKVNSGKYKSSLMFGVQWDLVLAFMNKDSKATTEVLNQYGKTIGNYYNSLWNISDTKSKYSINDGDTFIDSPYQKKSGARILLTTGAYKNYSIQNIYDIAGNVWEWTLEKTFSDNETCTLRGGSYDNSDTDAPASGRHYYSTSGSVNLIGFRISIF